MLGNLEVIHTVLGSHATLNPFHAKTLIDVLVPRSAYEIDTLRFAYRQFSGRDVGVNMSAMVSKSETNVRHTFIGLALGPALFDLWLAKNVLSSNASSNDRPTLKIF